LESVCSNPLAASPPMDFTLFYSTDGSTTVGICLQKSTGGSTAGGFHIVLVHAREHGRWNFFAAIHRRQHRRWTLLAAILRPERCWQNLHSMNPMVSASAALLGKFDCYHGAHLPSSQMA